MKEPVNFGSALKYIILIAQEFLYVSHYTMFVMSWHN